jgi:hypothetical protein
MTSVPDFFQDESEDALRAQVDWLEQHLGLGDSFFAKLLREDQGVFSGWRKAAVVLSVDKEDILRDWWHTVLHLLSFQNFQEGRVRALLEATAPAPSPAERSVFSPPWSCSSLKEYLEGQGSHAIREVDCWVQSFRFGDPYAPSGKRISCQSTQP